MPLERKTAKPDEKIASPAGDPGVGAMLADPLHPSPPHDRIDPQAGPASPDPAPPVAHQDWSPNKRPKVRSR